MSLHEFNLLPHERQLAAVYATGTLVATRWQEVNEAMNLYKLPGRFFVELAYNTDANEVLYLISF